MSRIWILSPSGGKNIQTFETTTYIEEVSFKCWLKSCSQPVPSTNPHQVNQCPPQASCPSKPAEMKMKSGSNSWRALKLGKKKKTSRPFQKNVGNLYIFVCWCSCFCGNRFVFFCLRKLGVCVCLSVGVVSFLWKGVKVLDKALVWRLKDILVNDAGNVGIHLLNASKIWKFLTKHRKKRRLQLGKNVTPAADVQ